MRTFGMDLLLDVERRRVHDQVGPVLLVLAAPDELRVEVAVAPLVGHADRVLLVLPHHGLKLGSGNILPRVASSCLRVSTVLFAFLLAMLPLFLGLGSGCVDHLDELGFDLGLEIFLDPIDLGELRKGPPAVSPWLFTPGTQ